MVDIQPSSFVPESVIQVSEQIIQEEAEKAKYTPEQMALWWNKLLEKFFPVSTQHIELNLQTLQDFIVVANNNALLQGPANERKIKQERRTKMVDAIKEFFVGEYTGEGDLSQKIVTEVDRPSFIKGRQTPNELKVSNLSYKQRTSTAQFMAETFEAYPDFQEYVESKRNVKFDQEMEETVDSYFFHDIGGILTLISGYVDLVIQDYKDALRTNYAGLEGGPKLPDEDTERITPEKEAELAEFLSFQDFLAGNEDVDFYFNTINSNLRQLHFMLEQFDLEEGKVSRDPDRLDLVLGQFGKLLMKEGQGVTQGGKFVESEVRVNFDQQQVWDVEAQLQEYGKHGYSRFNRVAVIRTVKNIISNFRKASKDLIKERGKFSKENQLQVGQDVPRPQLPEEVMIKNKRIAVERLLSTENDYRLDVTMVKNGNYLEFYFDDYNLGYPPDEKMTLIEQHKFSRQLDEVDLYEYVPERNKTSWIGEHGTGRGMVGLQKDFKDLLDGEMLMVNRARNGYIEGATVMIRVKIGKEEDFNDEAVEDSDEKPEV